MSFFVSKEIETLVDENCLMEKGNVEKTSLTLESQHSDFCAIINKVLFDGEHAKLEFKASLKDLEEILFGKPRMSLSLLTKKVSVDSFHIVELKRSGNDSYIIILACVLEKEF